MTTEQLPELELTRFHELAQAIEFQLSRVIVGQKQLINEILVTLLAGGNALLEGVPGLGKTLLVSTLADIVDCQFHRLQFTPDLMPADIVGTMIITETSEGRRGFRFEPGPIFANLILADEINRAAPRTQSALLEAMQERRVTVAGESRELPQPFFVLATQNPLEMEGTYPLPEAQLDRFLYKIHVPYPGEEHLVEIARRTTGFTTPQAEQITDGPTLIAMQRLVREVPVGEPVLLYAARIIQATLPQNGSAPDSVRQHIRVGASPRGLQAMVWAGKVEALLDGRNTVSIADIKKVAIPALRHRLLLNYEAQAQGVVADTIVADVLDLVKMPKL